MSSVKISAATAVGTLTDSYALPIGNVGNGASNNVTVATLAQYAAKYCSDINVVFHNYADKYLRNCPLGRYLNVYSSYQPIALEIIGDSHPLVVALTEPDEGTMYWASQSGGTGTYVTTQRAAIMDFDGETNTSNIISNCTYANAEGYAPYYCYHFSCISDDYGYGIGEGCWWLPSMGELRIIWSHLYTLNFALSCLSSLGYDADQLNTSTRYWSSTESSSAGAWYVGFSSGLCNTSAKASNSYGVRPVSIFQDGVTA